LIETTCSVTKADFLEAHQLWCPRAALKLPGAQLLRAIYIVLLTLLLFSLSHLPIPLIIGFMTCLLAYVVVVYWRKDRVLATQYTQIAEAVKDIALRLDDDGYQDHKEGISSCFIAWSRFSGWREGNRVFVLGLNLQFITIPKVALSQDHQDELRTLLQKSIRPH
jgi:hypothetical protein